MHIDESYEWTLSPLHFRVTGATVTPYPDTPSPDAMRLDTSRAEADAELAEWRALLDGAKGRRA